MRLEKGEIIGARYSLVRAIGEGGMGAVWAALDTKTNELVAIKVLRDEVKVPEVIRRFLREARAAMAVKHPNVVRIREVIMVEAAPITGSSSAPAEPVIVMDFLEGESLRTRLERVQRLPLQTFAQMFVSVVSAIGTAHAAGVVHRDLKPDNIFLMRLPDGRGEEPRVVDFGIAKLTAIEGDAKQSGHLTTTGAVLGTPYYMSPEQVFGDKHIDHRTDIWSLGTIAFECLSGQRPVEGDNIGQILKVITTGGIPRLDSIAPGLPADVYELVGRMLSFDRTKRPHDLREVLNVFQRHTTQAAQSFGGATLAMGRAPSPSNPDDGFSPFAATIGSDPSQQVVANVNTPALGRGSDNNNNNFNLNPHARTNDPPPPFSPPFASTTGGAAMSASSSAVKPPSSNRGAAIAAVGLVGVMLVAAIGIAVGVRSMKAKSDRHDDDVGARAASSVATPSVSSSNAVTPPTPSLAASLSPEAPTASPTTSPSSKPALLPTSSSQAQMKSNPNKPLASTSVAKGSSAAPPGAPSSPPTKTGAPIAPTNPYEQ